MHRCSAPLTRPQAKKMSNIRPGQPLPVPITTLSGVPASNNYWVVYRGRLVIHSSDKVGPMGRQASVVVGDEGAVLALTEHGHFGLVVIDGEWQDEARLEVKDWYPGEEEEELVAESIKQEDNNDEATDCHGEDDETEQIGPTSWGEVKDLQCPPLLYLELCEAFFLSYSLGCLTIFDPGESKEICLIDMWTMFCRLEPDFPLRYRAYHHYRAKGWVVKSGYQLGCDWALYKLGPPFYHASYTVRVEGVNRVSGEVVGREISGVGRISWADLLAQTRVAVTVRKEPLVCRIEMWGDKRDWNSPRCLASMAVITIRVRRWREGDSRWQVKPSVPTENNIGKKNKYKTDQNSEDSPKMSKRSNNNIQEERSARMPISDTVLTDTTKEDQETVIILD